MRIGIFGGTFDPVHREHVAAAKCAVSALGLDRLLIVPSFVSPHKQGRRAAPAEDRLAMCRLAFCEPNEEIFPYEIEQGGTSYSYLTCRRVRELYPDAERFFLLGTDMLDCFAQWKNPEAILNDVTLAVCGREVDAAALEARQAAFEARFHTRFRAVPFFGDAVSSTRLRTRAAFGEDLSALTVKAVAEYIAARGLYRNETLFAALALEVPARRAHTVRVAEIAAMRGKTLGLDEERILLAAGLHDVGKNLPADSPYLKGFLPPPCAPPVLHQYAGAYVAEHAFGVTDPDVLNAIRYHTSGRAGMGRLETLIFLADLVEEGRTFSGVEALRRLFWEDLDRCLEAALERQLAYLRSVGGEIDPLTEQTYRWIKRRRL